MRRSWRGRSCWLWPESLGVTFSLDSRPHEDIDLRVITSAFHAPRARHLFHVALSREPRIEVTVLAVANACSGELLQSYLTKERRTLLALRAEPFGAWLDFLRAHDLLELNGTTEVCEAHFLSKDAVGAGERRRDVERSRCPAASAAWGPQELATLPKAALSGLQGLSEAKTFNGIHCS